MGRRLPPPGLSVVVPNQTKTQQTMKSDGGTSRANTTLANTRRERLGNVIDFGVSYNGRSEVANSLLSTLGLDNVIIPSQYPVSVDILSFQNIQTLDICESMQRVNQITTSERLFNKLKGCTYKVIRRPSSKGSVKPQDTTTGDWQSSDDENIDWFVKSVLSATSKRETPFMLSVKMPTCIPQSSCHVRVSNALLRKWNQITLRRKLVDPSILNWKKDQDTYPLYAPIYVHPLSETVVESYATLNPEAESADRSFSTGSLDSQITLMFESSDSGTLGKSPCSSASTCSLSSGISVSSPRKGVLKTPSFEMDTLDILVRSLTYCTKVVIQPTEILSLQPLPHFTRQQVIAALRNDLKYNSKQKTQCTGLYQQCICANDWEKRFIRVKNEMIQTMLRKFWKLQLPGKVVRSNNAFLETPSSTVTFNDDIVFKEFRRTNREHLDTFGRLPNDSPCYVRTPKRGNITPPRRNASPYILIERPKTSSLIHRQTWRSMICEFFGFSVRAVISGVDVFNYVAPTTVDVAIFESMNNLVEGPASETNSKQRVILCENVMDDTMQAHPNEIRSNVFAVKPGFSESEIEELRTIDSSEIIASAIADITDMVAESTSNIINCAQGIAENAADVIDWAARNTDSNWAGTALRTVNLILPHSISNREGNTVLGANGLSSINLAEPPQSLFKLAFGIVSLPTRILGSILPGNTASNIDATSEKVGSKIDIVNLDDEKTAENAVSSDNSLSDDELTINANNDELENDMFNDLKMESDNESDTAVSTSDDEIDVIVKEESGGVPVGNERKGLLAVASKAIWRLIW